MSVRVLIVDDSQVMRRILESALRHSGLELAEVLHAANGMEALATLENSATEGRSLDLILCDLHMPQMNGLDFLLQKQRRNLAPGVPLVMITADAGDRRALQAAPSGAFSYLIKPFTLKQFQTCMQSLRPAIHSISGVPRSGPPQIP
jgi:two-component system chemotaxis response regulator CheY